MITEQDLKNRSILPLRVTETGGPDEPILEATICDSMSGGAQEKNGMPKELTLVRIKADGTEIRMRYVQAQEEALEEEKPSILDRVVFNDEKYP